MSLRVTKQNDISVYTVAGSDVAPSLPDWLARKRKRSLKSDETYMNRIELIQDFEFEEASQCIQVSEDGEYAVAAGTYKPQMHIYHLPSVGLKYDRHTSALNLTFLLLSSDYSKSLHLQTDRALEFHTPMGCHYSTRIPRYGRGLAYLKARAHAIIPAEGNEVYRLDLEAGQFLRPLELGGFEGPGGEIKAVECVGVADGSHGLLAFGTSAGTTEFWDPRSRNRVGMLVAHSNAGAVVDTFGDTTVPAVTATQFHPNGLTFATGSQAGMVTVYDIRSPTPLFSKDQGYGFPVHTLRFLSTYATEEQKLLAADKKVIKIFDTASGAHWTSIQPNVDLNHVCPVPSSGMIFTANEGKQMHSFLIPALGPSPWWCSHLDMQVEQLADRTVNDPDAYAPAGGATYENYKFLTRPEMRQLNLGHLLSSGKGAGVVRPYMHGFFVDQRLYDEARLIADPLEWERQRTRIIREKIEKERESRIRTLSSDKLSAKVKINKRLAERLETLDKKLNRKNGDAGEDDTESTSVLQDPRFKGLFENPDFTVDENSAEFRLLNPSTRPTHPGDIPERPKHGKTAVEEEEESSHSSNSEESSEEEERQSYRNPGKKEPEMRVSTSSYRKSGHNSRGYSGAPKPQNPKLRKEKTFGARVRKANNRKNGRDAVSSARARAGIGEKEITFYVDSGRKSKHKQAGHKDDSADRGMTPKNRRSASGNAFRREGLGR